MEPTRFEVYVNDLKFEVYDEVKKVILKTFKTHRGACNFAARLQDRLVS